MTNPNTQVTVPFMFFWSYHGGKIICKAIGSLMASLTSFTHKTKGCWCRPSVHSFCLSQGDSPGFSSSPDLLPPSSSVCLLPRPLSRSQSHWPSVDFLPSPFCSICSSWSQNGMVSQYISGIGAPRANCWWLLLHLRVIWKANWKGWAWEVAIGRKPVLWVMLGFGRKPRGCRASGWEGHCPKGVSKWGDQARDTWGVGQRGRSSNVKLDDPSILTQISAISWNTGGSSCLSEDARGKSSQVPSWCGFPAQLNFRKENRLSATQESKTAV